MFVWVGRGTIGVVIVAKQACLALLESIDRAARRGWLYAAYGSDRCFPRTFISVGPRPVKSRKRGCILWGPSLLQVLLHQ